MPIYEYICPGTDKDGHVFEKIVPMANGEEPQECPEHPGTMCPQKEFTSVGRFQWGVNVVDWSAGLSSNPNGMGRYKNK